MTRVARELSFPTLLIFLRTTMLLSPSMALKGTLSDVHDHNRKKPRNMGVKKDHDPSDVPMYQVETKI